MGDIILLFTSIISIYKNDIKNRKEVYSDENIKEAHGGVFGMGEPNTTFAQYFIGNSYLNPLTKQGKSAVFLANVTFEPSCRNNWHIHHSTNGGGQIIICVDGQGWYQEEGKEAQSLKVGDVVVIPANVKHWHGAKKDNWFSHIALHEVAKTLNEEGIETEIFWIVLKLVGGCIACKKCKELGRCVFDDVVNEFIEKAKDADGFIFGSPVHYAGATGNIVISARRAGTTATYDQLNKYFGITQMPIISSRYWNMVHGQAPEDVKKDEEGMQAIRILGRNMAYYLKCIEAGKEKGIKLQKQETINFTNFIR